MSNPAAELARLSWKKRTKGKTKKQISEMMSRAAKHPRPSRRKAI